MAEKRGRGRPPKKGKYKYHIRTGVIWGNLGMTQPAWNRPDVVKDTDTECKRAAQKFFQAFLKSATHRAVMSTQEQNDLTTLIQELDELHERQAPWEYDSFEGGELEFRWSCAWGDSGTFTAVARINRAAAVADVQPKGML